MDGPPGNSNEELNEDRLAELSNEARDEETVAPAPAAAASCTDAPEHPVFESWLTRYRQMLDAINKPNR